MTRHEDVARAVAATAPIPRDQDGGPVFREPWEAQAFAMVLALHERGVFTWTEWAQALSAEIRRAEGAGGCGDGTDYYRHWLSAIEGIVGRKGIASREILSERKDAWERAAQATPHGKPILLASDPARGEPGVT